MIRTLTQCSMVITAIVLLTLMLPATAQTQAMNPDTLLETPEILNDLNETPPTPELAPTPELIPEAPQWAQLNRRMDCNSLAYIKLLLEGRGQFLYAAGGFRPDEIYNDPFPGIIITRNPTTLEYTAILIKPDVDVACVIHVGQSIRSIVEE